MSNLKPFCHLSSGNVCKSIRDKTSELKRYQELFKTYPKNKLSPEAKIFGRSAFVDDNNPSLAFEVF